jgi:hypothetical protein
VYFACPMLDFGVPEMAPVVMSSANPEGSVGLIA